MKIPAFIGKIGFGLSLLPWTFFLIEQWSTMEVAHDWELCLQFLVPVALLVNTVGLARDKSDNFAFAGPIIGVLFWVLPFLLFFTL